MTTAATLLTETPIPTGEPAASGLGGSARTSFSTPFSTPFASLLAEGNFVQTPGMAPLENGETPSLAILFSAGRVGAALNDEDGPADPALNVFPLIDSTSLATPALVTPLPAPGFGVTTLIPHGASSDAPTGDSSAVSASAPAAGQPANLIPTSPTDSPQTTPARTEPAQQAPTHGDDDGHAIGPQPALKGVTAADVMAEIAQLSPAPSDGAIKTAPAPADGALKTAPVPVDGALKAAPVSPAGNRQSAPAVQTVAAASSNGDGQAAP